jgi:hypothetical protein
MLKAVDLMLKAVDLMLKAVALLQKDPMLRVEATALRKEATTPLRLKLHLHPLTCSSNLAMARTLGCSLLPLVHKAALVLPSMELSRALL